MITVGILTAVFAVLAVSCICYRIAFYAPRKAKPQTNEVELPDGEIYEEYREDFERWAREVRAMPREDMYIIAFDGLRLYGRYYEYAPGAPIELMFHGYRGSAERDLSGGVQRCFLLGHSALIVDQRCSGESEGHTITFGINEHRDCLRWIDYMLHRFGPDVQIILTGISMGASTVLMAAGTSLPDNIIGVIADCGYSSAKDIIQVVMGKMGLPPKLGYPFVKLAARIFGHFDLDETSPLEAVKNCTVPVFFVHGEDDDFVPCSMGRELYAACGSRKYLHTVPGAGHGLAYPADPEAYLVAAKAFFTVEEGALKRTEGSAVL